MALAVLAWLGVQSVKAEGRPYEDLICSRDWPCEQAMRVAQCESSLNPSAYNAGNIGLFQVSRIHVSDPSALFDPETNVAVAYRLWTAQGWAPWACRP